MATNLYEKYAQEQRILEVELRRLEHELQSMRHRVELVSSILQDIGELTKEKDSGQLSAPAGAPARAARPAAPARPLAMGTPSIGEDDDDDQDSDSLPTSSPFPARRGVPAAARTRAQQPTRGRGRPTARTGGSLDENEDINVLSIVDATLVLARQRNVTEADAGDVHAWFREANFERRNGQPSRNSIYVSLNREATLQKDSENWRIRKISRGRFQFRWDAT